MARLQIVTLPTLTVGAVSQPEYLIILDEVDDASIVEALNCDLKACKTASGARGILVFQGRVEVVREQPVPEVVPARPTRVSAETLAGILNRRS